MVLLLRKNVVLTFVVYFDETVFNDCNETTNESEWQNYNDSKNVPRIKKCDWLKAKAARPSDFVFVCSANNVLIVCFNIAGCLSTICIDFLALWFKQIYKCVECWIWNTSLLCIFMHTDVHTRSCSYIHSAPIHLCSSSSSFFSSYPYLSQSHWNITKLNGFNCIVPFKIHWDAFHFKPYYSIGILLVFLF